MSPTRLIILGSTGSIGINTLRVVEHLHARTERRFDIVGLATGSNAEAAFAQAEEFHVPLVAVANGGEHSTRARQGVERITGENAACELIDRIAQPGDLVMCAMVGAVGIRPALAAIERGCDLAIANKETLVAAGEIVMQRAAERGVRIIPVDSEHNAIFQCLRGDRSPGDIHRVVLTASGGPFRTWSPQQMRNATVEEALNHPTWEMGNKNTIDSATLMNKTLEVIEARWLFDLAADRIDVLIHPASIVHGFVEFRDGSVLAQLSPPDMQHPIQYALTYPDRETRCAARLDFTTLSSLEFEQVDREKFPAIDLARRVIDAGGTSGTLLNAANEVAVEAFLTGRITLPEIGETVAAVLDGIPSAGLKTLDDCFAADRAARDLAAELVGQTADAIAEPR